MDRPALAPADIDWHPLENSALPVTGMISRYAAGHVVAEHSHARGHLLYAAKGILVVEADSGRWLVPPTAAVWLRPHVRHRLGMPVATQLECLFISETASTALPQTDCVVHASPLLRALIAALTQVPPQAVHGRRDSLLGELLLEEMALQPALPVYLPWPLDERMRQVCDTLAADPSHAATADAWAATLSMSGKTFHRHFQKGTGMGFGEWRRQLRLMSSLAPLLDGAPVMQVALGSGYESHSAYATAFKKHFGCSPTAFLADISSTGDPHDR